jgi:hypothetical protein
MEGFSFVTPVTGLNRRNTGKEDDDDYDDDNQTPRHKFRVGEHGGKTPCIINFDNICILGLIFIFWAIHCLEVAFFAN